MFSWKCPFLMGNWTRVRKRTEACSVKGSNGGPRPPVMVGAQIITRNCIRLGSEHFSMFWSFASFLHNTHWWAYTTWQGASKSIKNVRPSCSASSSVLHWSRGTLGARRYWLRWSWCLHLEHIWKEIFDNWWSTRLYPPKEHPRTDGGKTHCLYCRLHLSFKIRY